MSALSPLHDTLPQYVGAYKIECLLDKGGTSAVYLALNPETKEPIAIKVLLPKYVSHPQAVDNFLAEAAVMETTNHPNITKIFGYGRWEGGVYIAMEFIQGISLRQMILQQAMTLRRAVEVTLQIAHALTHLHVHGIIYRDLKPENILLTAQGGVKLIDFGTAKLFTATEEKQQLLGTPSYMSPEQRKDSGHVTFSSDIFSLGVIFYELILGRLCYGTIQLSLIPKGLQPILSRMLQPDPLKRFEDIVDVVQALSGYLGSDVVLADMRGSDYIGEFNEDLKQAQALLLPQSLPQWPNLTLGFASNCTTALSAVYYDCFVRAEGMYTVVMGESLATGVKGLLDIAMLRGMVRALARKEQTPSLLVGTLNDLLVDLNIDQAFSFALLTLIPQEQRFSFISCGYNPLWQISRGSNTPRHIVSNHVALGIERGVTFLEVDANWALGDTLILHTFQAGTAKQIDEVKQDEEVFMQALKQNLQIAGQQQVDAIFRNIMQKDRNVLLQKMITVISIERK